MTLPVSGPISFNAINVELGVAGTTNANINQASYRTLAGIPASGTTISLSNFYGKSNRVARSFTFTTSTANASLNVAAISGYVAGITDITVTVNPSVYLWASTTGNYGLTLTGGASGDTVTLVNNGFIMGCGGSQPQAGSNGLAGGPALILGFPTTINNTNPAAYIGGGGGSGGNSSSTGGGGAGGGVVAGGGGPGGGGGAIGASGSPGFNGGLTLAGMGGGAGGGGGTYAISGRSSVFSYGGGGGRIFPGVGGAGASTAPFNGGAGGSANGAGGSMPGGGPGAGGGGGWGASGGNSAGAGGAGGRAVFLNGRTVTWVSGNTTRVYGAVS
jgi:hypothetical protein